MLCYNGLMRLPALNIRHAGPVFKDREAGGQSTDRRL